MTKNRLPIILMLTLIVVTGCSHGQEGLPDAGMNGQPSLAEEIDEDKEQSAAADGYENNKSNSAWQDIAAVCHDIYDEADREDTSKSLEMTRNIINDLGERGYAVVDSENQVNMANAGQIMGFCEQVDAGEEAEMAIIVVAASGGFTEYDFRTEDGNVDIARNYYRYINGQLNNTSTGTYRADLWQYTEEGYLLFEGRWFSEEQYVLVASEVPERVALRVEPLSEKCRELNREYIMPIGYRCNNMFLSDWSEDDFGDLDFYDLFDIFYPLIIGHAVPYAADDDLNTGVVYRIEKEEFEAVIMPYFNIDSKTLQSMTTYLSEEEAYEYRPRGFYEMEYPEMPYPEVVGYTVNNDGTMTLTVNVVYPNEMTSKVYAHEVVVRPLDGGGAQYVSNRIIPSDENSEQTWYIARLTREKWEEVYGKQGNVLK